MTWFKVDDKLHDHRKTRAAGKAAMGVWVLAGSWAADNLTDGFVPAALLSRWGTRADANKLVAAGLWHPDEQDGEKGWRFHQWTVNGQPSRTQKLAEREARAAAGRVGGRASGRSRREANPKHVASQIVEPPTRPDPSNAAAAASAPPPQPLSETLEILRAALEAQKLVVRWDRLTHDDAAEIERLVDVHGDAALVRSAVHQFQPNRPAAFVTAWLPGWRDLRAPGDLRAVEAPPCTEPGHTGTVRHCAQCSSEQKAAR